MLGWRGEDVLVSYIPGSWILWIWFWRGSRFSNMVLRIIWTPEALCGSKNWAWENVIWDLLIVHRVPFHHCSVREGEEPLEWERDGRGCEALKKLILCFWRDHNIQDLGILIKVEGQCQKIQIGSFQVVVNWKTVPRTVDTSPIIWYSFLALYMTTGWLQQAVSGSALKGVVLLLLLQQANAGPRVCQRKSRGMNWWWSGIVRECWGLGKRSYRWWCDETGQEFW